MTTMPHASSLRQADFHLLAKPTGAACNLDCKYCFLCSVRFAGHGECPKNRFITTPDGEPGLNYLCAGDMAFFTYIDRPMRVMADLLRQGRYADEAMAMLS